MFNTVLCEGCRLCPACFQWTEVLTFFIQTLRCWWAAALCYFFPSSSWRIKWGMWPLLNTVLSHIAGDLMLIYNPWLQHVSLPVLVPPHYKAKLLRILLNKSKCKPLVMTSNVIVINCRFVSWGFFLGFYSISINLNLCYPASLFFPPRTSVLWGLFRATSWRFFGTTSDIWGH